MQLNLGSERVSGSAPHRRRKRDACRGALIGFAGLLSVGLAACSEPQADAGGGGWERPPSPVSVVPAIAEDVPVYLDEIGKCVAREVVAIQPQVSGRITEIHVADGADVKLGDVLFTIDPRQYQALVDSAAASLAQTKAVLGLAKTEYTRATELVNSKSVSRSDLDLKKNAVAVAEAQINQAEAALETAKLNLDYCSIRSPINGRAGQRLVDLGNVVTPNSGPLLIIQRLDPIYGEFTIAENNLTAVQQNLANGALRVEIRLPDETAEPRTGELTFVDNAVQETTGTVKLRATIPNEDRRFWPGRFVKIRLVLRTIAGAVLIPANASQMSARGPFVYVIKDDSTAELRNITLGQRQGDRIVVSEGLKAGEKVVVTGQMGVMPGGKVKVEEPAVTESAPPSPSPGASS